MYLFVKGKFFLSLGFILIFSVYLTSTTSSFDLRQPIHVSDTNDYQLELSIEWGGSANDEASDIALDSSGNIYITGITHSYGVGNGDVYIAKYNTSGILQWYETWGGSQYDEGYTIEVDNSGNIYVGGITFSFGGGNMGFLLKYNAQAILQWSSLWSASGADSINDITFDSNGNIIVLGTINPGWPDVFVSKYNIFGNSILNFTWGESLDDTGIGIQVDDSDYIYVTGRTSNFGASGSDTFLAKFNRTGQSLMNLTWGDSPTETGWDIVLDSSDNIYIAGSENSGVSANAKVWKINNTGELLLNLTWDAGYYDEGNSIALDSLGNIYLSGHAKLSGDNDAFIAMFDPMGVSIFNATWGENLKDDRGKGLVLDSVGSIYIAGAADSFSSAFIAKYSVPGDDTPSQPIDTITFLLIITLIYMGILLVGVAFLLKENKTFKDQQQGISQKQTIPKKSREN